MHDTARSTPGSLLLATLALGALQAGDVSAAVERQSVCETGSITRILSLRSNPNAEHVCDVLYEKPDEAVPEEVLWFARNDPGYCEPRLVDLVEELSSEGWTCRTTDGADAEDGVAPLARSVGEEGESEVSEPVAETLESVDEDALAGEGESAAGESVAEMLESVDEDVLVAEVDGSSEPAPEPEPSAEPPVAAASGDVRDQFLERCSSDPANGSSDGASSERYCDCMFESLVSSDVDNAGFEYLATGLPAQPDDAAERGTTPTLWGSKALNSLMIDYDYADRSCR